MGGRSGPSGNVHHSDAWVFCLEALGPKCPSSQAWIELAKGGGPVFPGSGAPGVHSMAAGYDADNDRVLVYGGQSVVGGNPWLLEDLWELDLSTGAWRNLGIPPSGPLGLVGSAYATDPIGKRLLLYAGLTGRILRGRATVDITEDVWEIPLVQGPPNIRKVATAPEPRRPSGRYHHAVVAPRGRPPIVLGGEFWDGLAQDAWQLNFVGREMVEIKPAGSPPWPRADFTATSIPELGETWIFGGRVDTRIYDAWLERLVLTPGAERWESTQLTQFQSLERFSHSAVYDPAGRRLIVHGGVASVNELSDTVAISVSSGAAVATRLASADASGPLRRYGHVAGYDATARRMIVYGGTVVREGGVVEDANDVWELPLDSETPRWHKLDPSGTPPPPMFYARGDVTAERPPRLVVLGTIARAGSALDLVDGLWELKLERGQETWKKLNLGRTFRPHPRGFPAVTYDPVYHELWLSGGAGELTARNDLWALELP